VGQPDCTNRCRHEKLITRYIYIRPSDVHPSSSPPSSRRRHEKFINRHIYIHPTDVHPSSSPPAPPLTRSSFVSLLQGRRGANVGGQTIDAPSQAVRQKRNLKCHLSHRFQVSRIQRTVQFSRYTSTAKVHLQSNLSTRSTTAIGCTSYILTLSANLDKLQTLWTRHENYSRGRIPKKLGYVTHGGR
jgi:hypothetical protein